MGGLLAATILTLVFLPVLYVTVAGPKTLDAQPPEPASARQA
jgi:hypothetical protein